MHLWGLIFLPDWTIKKFLTLFSILLYKIYVLTLTYF